MTVRVSCGCGRVLNLAEDLRGKRIRCPQCSEVLMVPEASAGPKPEKPSSAARPRSASVGPAAKSSPPSKPANANRPSKPASRKPANAKPASTKRRPAKRQQSADDQAWLDESSYQSDAYDDGDYGFSSAADSPAGTRKSAGSRKKKKSGKKMSPVAMVAIGCGSIVMLGIIAVVVLVVSLTGEGDTSDLPDAATIAVPETALPQNLVFRQAFPSGVELASTRLTGAGPGQQTQMNIYRPPGQHAPGSLGCVLVAPAGTNLLVGNPLDGADYHDETLPYAEAGYVTIQYSLDGPVRDLETASTSELSQAYSQFRAAGAGTVNTRSVIEFVKQRLPEVDSSRIYTAGHSSAGTVSLLAAELMPNDVAACIAYAPCSDPEAFHSDAPSLVMNSIFPGIKGFDKKYSPINNAASLKCPLFLFQAADDSVVEAAETRRMSQVVQQHNQQVKYVEVPTGDHYDPMITSGIPQAIQWLKQLEGAQ